MMKIARLLWLGLFKGVSFVLAVVLIIVVWIQDASYIVALEDSNLRAIKLVTTYLPSVYGSKVEATLRLLGADKAFIFVEATAFVKLMLYIFHKALYPIPSRTEK